MIHKPSVFLLSDINFPSTTFFGILFFIGISYHLVRSNIIQWDVKVIKYRDKIFYPAFYLFLG